MCLCANVLLLMWMQLIRHWTSLQFHRHSVTTGGYDVCYHYGASIFTRHMLLFGNSRVNSVRFDRVRDSESATVA